MIREIIHITIGFSLCLSILNGQEIDLNGPAMDQGLNIVNPSANILGTNNAGSQTVDKSTGTLTLSVPLENVTIGGFSMPISCQYTASGIQVNQESTQIGTGWSLSAGGSISRSIMGRPDESICGYFNQDYSNVNPPPQLWDVFDNCGDGDFPGFEPDIFHYNFGGQSGKFVIDQNGEVKELEKSNIIFTPKPNLANLTHWEAVDGKGNIYLFNVKDYTRSFTESGDWINVVDAVSTWHLSQVILANGHVITLAYDKFEKITNIPLGHSYSQVDCVPIQLQSTSFTPQYQVNTYDNYLLKSISSIDKTVEFVYNDFGGNITLDRLKCEIEGNLVSIKEFDYSTHLGTARVKLEQIKNLDASGSECTPPHKFNYLDEVNPAYKLPPFGSYDQDHWGYYNKANNLSTLPFIPEDEDTYFQSIFGSKDAHPEGSLAGLLSTYTSPLGDVNQFTYEPNSYSYIGQGPAEAPLEVINPINICYGNCDDYSDEEPGLPCELSPPAITQSEILINTPQAITFNWINGSQIEGESFYTGHIEDQYGNIVIDFGPTNTSQISTLIFQPGTYTLIITSPLGINVNSCFSLEFDYTSFALDQYNQPIVEYTSIPCGGARIKQISNSKGTITYSYQDSSTGLSSGSIQHEPEYITNYSQWIILQPNPDSQDFPGGFAGTCPVKTIGSSSMSNSRYLNGSHILYGEVAEIYEDNSKTISKFEKHASAWSLTYPAVPVQDNSFKRGYLTEETVYNSSNTVVQETKLDYEFQFTNESIPAYRWVFFPANPNGFPAPIKSVRYDHYSQKRFLTKKTTTHYDQYGLANFSTIEDYKYDYNTYNLIKSNISDGTQSRLTSYTYADVLDGSMSSRNLVEIPLEIISGWKGQKTTYKTTPSNSGLPGFVVDNVYGSTIGNNYQSSGFDISGWKYHAQFTNHEADYMKPLKLYQRAAPNVTDLAWSSGLLTTKTYGSRVDAYNYYSNRLLQDHTDPAGVFSDFAYDSCLRLDNQSSLNGRSSQTVLYDFYPTGENSITTTTSYAGSIPSLTTKSILDASGRNTVSNAYAYFHGGGNYLTNSTYNFFDSPTEVTDPVVGQGSTINTYEQSPLQRILSTTPAGSPRPITYEHLIDPILKLFRVRTTDENGHVSETKTDIFGRTIESIQIVDGAPLVTRYQYNDRDQVIQIDPPGSGAPYLYTYYDDGLLWTKTVPDEGQYTYEYNVHDQIIKEKTPQGHTIDYIYNAVYNDFVDQIIVDGQMAVNNLPYQGSYVTGWVGRTEVLEQTTGQYVTTDFDYDDIGQVTKETFTGIDGISYISCYDYDALGNVIYENTDLVGPDGSAHSIVKTHTFHRGIRHTRTMTTVNGNEVAECDKTYSNNNETLLINRIGDALQAIDYSYNPRHWLTKINSVEETYIEDDPCEEEETDCDDVIQAWYEIAISMNCVNLRQGSPTGINVSIQSEDKAFSKEFTIPLNGFSGKKEYNTDQALAYSMPSQPDNQTMIDAILDYLDDCLDLQLGDITTDVINGVDNNVGPIAEGTTVSTEDLFGMEIFYYTGNGMLEAAPQYNGNISWMKWRAKGVKEPTHQYGFTYDTGNRLKKAKYGNDPLPCEDPIMDAYTVSGISYDARGNILGLNRRGLKEIDANGDPVFDMIDQLSYAYSGTNLLSKITEGGLGDKGYLHNGGAFSYQAGNLASGNGNTVGNYNHLNLPLQITTQTGSTTNYYDANGMKHKSEVVHDGETFIYHYVKGMEFINQAAASVYLSEGRYTWEREDNGTLIDEYYEWCFKDHLGNTRAKFADKNGDGGILYNPEAPEEDEILGTYHYYPFGMEMEGVWTPDSKPEMQYLYNGKEQVKGLGWYDYGFRYYDPSIGRFTCVDPISDKFPHASTYNYAENRPVNGIDLWGLQFVDANDAKIYMHNGGASLKRSNLSNPTNYRINAAIVVSGRTSDGGSYLSTTFPTRVGSLNFNSGPTLERRKPATNQGIVSNRSDFERRMMRNYGANVPQNQINPIPTGSGGKGIGVLWVLSESANMITNEVVNRDLNIADSQFAAYGSAVEQIVTGAVDSGLIPEELQTGQILGDIANYIFQGEFVNTYDDATFQQMRDVSQSIIQEAGIQLNCDKCQQDQK